MKYNSQRIPSRYWYNPKIVIQINCIGANIFREEKEDCIFNFNLSSYPNFAKRSLSLFCPYLLMWLYLLHTVKTRLKQYLHSLSITSFQRHISLPYQLCFIILKTLSWCGMIGTISLIVTIWYKVLIVCSIYLSRVTVIIAIIFSWVVYWKVVIYIFRCI